MIKSHKGVTVTYTEMIPTSKQMAEFYVWQDGFESYATITYLDRTVEVERGGEMYLSIPDVTNGELSEHYQNIVRYSDDLSDIGIKDDIQLTQFIKTISNSGYQVYHMNPWWETLPHNDHDMGDVYDTFYEAVEGGIEYIMEESNWED
jgi:hypothetical protein